MRVPPPNSPFLAAMQAAFLTKGIKSLSSAADITEQAKQLGIAEKLLTFVRKRSLPGFDANGRADD